MKKGYTYIMMNAARTMMYVGVTNNIERRSEEHNNGEGSIFTSKYNIKYLVYYEEFDDIRDAIAREKTLKNWHREWKFNLIKSVNPELKEIDFR